MNMEDKDIDQVLSLYLMIDSQTSLLKTATSLNCPAGCGICCASPRVEATVVEMLPIVRELARGGEAEMWLEHLEHAADDVCVFYDPGQSASGGGSCRYYFWRPSVCRLFGFASAKDKNGKIKLAACVQQKKALPGIVEAAERAVANGLQIPNLTDYNFQFSGFDAICKLMPVNKALGIALEKYAFRIQMMQKEC